MSDISRLLIQHVVDSTGDEYDKVHAVRELFGKEVSDLNARAWRFIEGYHEHYHEAPTLTVFRKNFPAGVFKFVQGDETPLDALVAEAHKDILSVQLFQVLNTTLDLHDRGEYDKAAAELVRWSERDSAAIAADGFPDSLDATLLDTLPPIEPLIEGVLDINTVSVLGGSSGSAKSFIAVDWSLCIATSKSWMNREVEPGKVLYVAAEGAYGMRTRVKAWLKHYKRELEPGQLTFLMAPVQFANAAHVAKLSALLKADDYALVVIDTQARSTVGLEENSATDMGKFIDALYRMRNESDTTVLVIHHTGYDTSRTRGSSANFAAVDAEYMTEVPKDSGPHQEITLRCTKRKDAAQMKPMSLKLKDILLGPGESSCVVEEQDAHTPDTGFEYVIIQFIIENEGCTTLEIFNHVAGHGFSNSEKTLKRRLDNLSKLGKIDNTYSTRETDAKRWFVPADVQACPSSVQAPGSLDNDGTPPVGGAGLSKPQTNTGSRIGKAAERKTKKVRR